MRVDPADTLLFHIKAVGLPLPEREYRYAKGRKHKADLAWPAKDHRLLCEVQGGIYSRQAHGSITGVLKDNERLNLATLNGWRMVRVTPDQVKNGEAIALLETLLKKGAP